MPPILIGLIVPNAVDIPPANGCQTCALRYGAAMKAARQQSFEFRAGAGRKFHAERERMPHRVRRKVRAHQPVHVTLGVADHVVEPPERAVVRGRSKTERAVYGGRDARARRPHR